MPDRRSPADLRIFIDCRFAEACQPVFHALVFAAFRGALPDILSGPGLGAAGMTFGDHANIASEWQGAQPRLAPPA